MTRLTGLAMWLAGVAATAAAMAAETDPLINEAQQNRRELIRSLIASPIGDSAGAELQKTMDRIQAIRMRPKAPATDTTPPNGAEAARPGAQGSAAEAQQPPEKPEGLVTAEDLERLRGLPADRIGNPLALADALFVAEHHKEACAFYEAVLKGDKDNKDGPGQAWALFQMANCQRRSDPTKAIELYGRLVTEHADSLWARVAETYRGVLQGITVAAAIEMPKPVAATAAEKTAPPSTEKTAPPPEKPAATPPTEKTALPAPTPAATPPTEKTAPPAVKPAATPPTEKTAPPAPTPAATPPTEKTAPPAPPESKAP